MKPTLTRDYAALLTDIKERIRSAQYAALKSVNRELIGLYWDIGRMITERQVMGRHGDAVVKQLAADLQAEFPGTSGFSWRNLFNMREFYLAYRQLPKLQPLVAIIGWTHNLTILHQCKDDLEREFYLRMTRKFGWSKNVLIHQIENQTYEKTLLNQTNFDKAVPEKYRHQAKIAVKDEYTFGFLELGEEHDERELERAIKDEKDLLRIVFVCAMWITGFDVPCCSTIYLDKPMKNHTLMQTIARANRTFPEKNNGLIVDYVGIFRNLQKALAIYGSDAGGGIKPGETPVHDKKELVAMLKAVVTEAEAFCNQRKVDILAAAAETRAFERTAMIADAVERLIYPEDDKKEFLRKVGLVVRIHKAVMPDPVAHDFDGVRRILEAIAVNLRPSPDEVDISEVMKVVELLLDKSIATKGYVIREKDEPYGKQLVDLSQIDFKALKAHFEKGQQRTVIDRLKAAIEQRLQTMVRLNQSRLDYLLKFQQMIEEYNSGSKNIEQFFKELTAFVRELDDEEKRGIREGLSDEELALFDILTKPEMKMTAKERAAVKKVVQELLQRLRSEKLVLDWKKRQQSRADVRLAIETMLDELPRTYTRTIYAQKCDLVYQHIFESYQDAGHSVYAAAG